MVYRFALLLILAFLGNAASAYTATSTPTWAGTPGASITGSSPTALCSGSAAVAFCTGYSMGYVRTDVSGTSANCVWKYGSCPACEGTCFVLTQSGSAYSCPGGGTLSGSTCTCPSGYTDTGSACTAPTCSAAGTDTGTHNVTMGYALSSTPDAADVASTTTPSEVFGASHCLHDGSGYCSMTIDTTQPTTGCWRGQTPTDEGLYRLSCDFSMKSAGTAACTPGDTSSSSPALPPPDCPTGNVGSVNGKAVCLGTMPAGGINFGKPQVGGNPRAGTSPVTDSNSAREPGSGVGGGPDARGGPGVTTGPGGSVGTGNNKTGGGTGGGASGPGAGIEIPTDYAREATAAATKTAVEALKADIDAATAAAPAHNATITAHKDALTTEYYNKDTYGMPSSEDNPYTPASTDALRDALPGRDGSCVTYPMTLPSFGTVNIDPCPLLDFYTPVINWAFMFGCVLSAIFLVFGYRGSGEVT